MISSNRACRTLLVAIVLLASGASAAHAQNVLSSAVQGNAPAAAAIDALGRQTPAGTVVGFLSAGATGDWARASRYLDTKQPPAKAQELAQELKIVMDRGLTVDLDRISRKPEGEQDERVGKDHEIIGTLEGASSKVDVVLVRVHYADQPAVWLFSPETIHGVSTIHEEFEPSLIEQYLPRSFTQGYGLRYMSWSWFVVLISVLAAALLAIGLTGAFHKGMHLLVTRVSPGRVWPGSSAALRPMRWLLFGIIMQVLSGYFLTLRQRNLGTRISALFVIGSVVWLVVLFLGSAIRRWAHTLERRGTTERIALVRLAGRLLQTVVVVIGVLSLLQSVGVNLTPVLAGLGVGGIAVALASQKTLENLFGGMMVIGDSPVRIGNFCRVGSITGTIEDIGLRSTRIRTLNRTTVSIPNADLASQSIENFATRDKMLCNHTITLRYETTADQLRFVIAEARALLYRHEKIEAASARFRLLRLAPSGLDIELFAYLEATDYETFLGIQEDVLLRIMDIIESSGTALAFPSQTMYFARDAGVDKDRGTQAEAVVRGWRERGGLPFPDHRPAEKARLHGEVEYPPTGSALRDDVVRT